MENDKTIPITRAESNPDLELPDFANRDRWVGRIIGDFQVDEPLGQGGMGMVYKGRQLSLNRPVALKFLPTGHKIKSETIFRFEAEARIAARLNHPNIVQIYALGNADDLPFIAMEFVPGRNLGTILSERKATGLGLISLNEAVGIMKQACLGLKAAAELGLIHRDIKPENLMLTPKGEVKIADFGLARSLQDNAAQLTQTGYTLGTPLYMSPEQVQGLHVDTRSDIYSLGMTFYHLLTNEPPLMADSPYLLAMKQLNEYPADVCAIRSDCPVMISDLIRWMIEKNPHARPADIGEVLDNLNDFTSHSNFGTGLRYTKAVKSSPVRSKTIISSGFEPFSAPSSSTSISKLSSRRFWALWAVGTTSAALLAAVFGRSGVRSEEKSGSFRSTAWPPCLNMAYWQRIPRKDTAEQQYRYAQLGASDVDQLAAWLSVPGYFAEDQDWIWRAYVQLASDLVRSNDQFRLTWLAIGIESSGRGVQYDNLVRVLNATLEGLDDNEIGLLENLHPLVKETMDPNLAELILNVLVMYRQRLDLSQAVPTRVEKLQTQILEILRIDPRLWPGNLPLNSSNR